MADPGVGVPSDDIGGACAFNGPTGNGPCCPLPAVTHVRVISGEWGEVALAACDNHADIARRAGRLVAQHTHEGWCGMPGTVWLPENRCDIDASGVEPETKALAYALADEINPKENTHG